MGCRRATSAHLPRRDSSVAVFHIKNHKLHLSALRSAKDRSLHNNHDADPAFCCISQGLDQDQLPVGLKDFLFIWESLNIRAASRCRLKHNRMDIGCRLVESLLKSRPTTFNHAQEIFTMYTGLALAGRPSLGHAEL